MYQPKLPVTGVSFFMLGVCRFFNSTLKILLIVTLSIILFRFIRLLIKEGVLNKLIKIICVLSLILFAIIVLGKIESNIKIQQSEEKLNEYKKALDNIDNEQTFYADPDFIESTDKENIINYHAKSGDVIGLINIEKISLELPIIEDANDENLWIGAAHIKGTPYYWEKGNSFLSSHNIKNYGKLFNRLNELVIGDKIIVSDYNDRFDYVVYHIEVVSPDDIMCFSKIKGEYNLSLVTCTKAGSKRLIVYSERI